MKKALCRLLISFGFIGTKVRVVNSILSIFPVRMQTISDDMKKELIDKVLAHEYYKRASIFDQALADSYINQFDTDLMTEEQFKISIHLLLQIQL